MSRLLITGADGFTGRHLSEAAKTAGYEVYPLAVNLTDALAVAAEVAAIAPTHVAHLAAISAVMHADEAAFYQVNLFGTLNLLKALSVLPLVPQKVLLASSANVYGNQGGEEAITETLCPKPVNHYAMSKLAMEHMAATYVDRLPLVITRPFNYTGVGHDNRFVIPKIVEHFKRGASEVELGNLDVYREYNDVRMVCDAYLNLLTAGVAGETYNVCSGNAYALRDVIDTAENISRKQIEVRVNPAFVRANEVHKLVGSPAKLMAAIGGVQLYTLEDTMTWMLE